MVPGLEISDIVAASYCPLDGHATPEDVVQAYAGAAAAQGVQILQATALERIAVLGDKIVSVETSAGRIRTDTVICTAGVWSRDVGQPRRARHPGARRGALDALHAGGRRPAGASSRSRSTSRPASTSTARAQGLVFGGREPTIEGVASHGTRRLPVLAELPIQSSWWGYYEMSPDHNAIVGEVAQPRRFLYATGFSGHGFQQAPAVGEHLAELVAGAEPTLDLSPLSLDRFASGAGREERFVV